MSKSIIIKELANNEITLDVAFNRLLIISNDLENTELYDWCLKELNGYEIKDKLPLYRSFKTTNLVYTGINNQFLVTDQPLLVTTLPQKYLNEIISVNYRDGINSLISSLDSKNELCIDLTYYAGYVLEKTGIQCTSIKKLISINDLSSILNKIRTLLLTIYIKLDKEIGNLDSLDVSTNTLEKLELDSINSQINSYIVYDNHKEMIR